MRLEEVQKSIMDADMVLVGLGEEFDDLKSLKKEAGYARGLQYLRETEKMWLAPAYQEWCREGMPERSAQIYQALERLAGQLEGKNYFVVSVSTNDRIGEIPWKDGRLVRPLGGTAKKCCSAGCREEDGRVLVDVTARERKSLGEWFARLSYELPETKGAREFPKLGSCPVCGRPLQLNNVYASAYVEEDYLPDWQRYMKWLQGTLNRKLTLLELGVGMDFPTVVRWPFEKTAFLHQKAILYRVNETLYQMTAELKGKGVSICANAIDWLLDI